MPAGSYQEETIEAIRGSS